jgi:hypothetical protein
VVASTIIFVLFGFPGLQKVEEQKIKEEQIQDEEKKVQREEQKAQERRERNGV